VSLLNLIVQADCAYLMTDSGTYDEDGTVSTLGPKVIVMPHHGLAIGTSGKLNCYLLLTLVRALEHLPRHKFLLELPHIAKAANDLYDIDSASVVAVAGFSEDMGRAFGLVLTTGETGELPDLVPYELTPRKTTLLPYPPAIQKALGGLSAYNPLTDSLPLLEQQRRVNFGTAEDPQICVAGDINVVAVSREGLRVRTIHTYPDRVGEKVALDSSALV
jgi:hypothetical protein